MHPQLLKKLYKQKKKREVDPNAPPRPTLLGQVKELKDTRAQIEDVNVTVAKLQQQVSDLEAKVRAQHNFIQALSQRMYRS